MRGISELAGYLKEHEDWAVMGHVNPDGDAAGSCIALALALKNLGKRAFVCLPDGLPEIYRPFPCTVEIISRAQDMPFAPRSALSVDVSEIERLGFSCEIFESCPNRAMLDHHPTNPGFGDIFYIDGKAAASGEIATKLILEMGLSLTLEMATWLYIAICTDCGRFGYSSTRAETMEAAAACLRAGVDVDEIHRQIYCTRSEGRTRLLGLALSGLERDETGQICWARLTQEMYRRAGALPEDNEGIVNYLLEIRGVKYACLAEERGSGTKLSLRSKPPYDVAKAVALPLGGGGHMCAAGAFVDRPLEEALQMALKLARAALEGEGRA